MKENTSSEALQRKEQLKKVTEIYFDSLKNKNFSTIPYDDSVSLRAPIVPGGVSNPLTGKEAVKTKWWEPLEPALEGITISIFDHYFNENLTGVITEAEITLANPSVTLRVADRFTINSDGKITEQENHFDASSLTNPG